MRLSGLGLTGEYAWIMRCAKGFAVGKGRDPGVLGTGAEEEAAEDVLEEFIKMRSTKVQGGAKEVFQHEFSKVVLAFKVVISRWLGIPGAM